MRSFTLNEVLFLLEATRWTIAVTLLAFVGGGILGLVIMFLKIVNSRLTRWTATIYVELFQGTPLLAQLFVVYFGFGAVRLRRQRVDGGRGGLYVLVG